LVYPKEGQVVNKKINIDCLSDLHGHYPVLPGGDLLIIAGDLTSDDTNKEWCKFEHWLFSQTYEQKIIIAGNHDNFLQSADKHRMWKYWDKVPNVTYLCDSGTEFEGLKIWGSPWTIKFPGQNPNCMAFTVNNENEYSKKLECAPNDIDILITHEPPYGIRDMIRHDVLPDVRHAGSRYLYAWLKYVQRPYLHVFGHIHEGYGIEKEFLTWDHKHMISVNASHVNQHYNPINQSIRIELNVQPIQFLQK
jgi:Icc-related predicted phosphoesterase